MSTATGVPLGHLFLQLAVILVVCRACSRVMRWIGQPAIIGEMIAGIVLGPSLLGALAPGIAGYLFPTASKPILFDVAQLGLSLYMFVVGLDSERLVACTLALGHFDFVCRDGSAVRSRKAFFLFGSEARADSTAKAFLQYWGWYSLAQPCV
jgi:hypothetical protein